MKISSLGHTDVATWEDFWLVAVQLTGVCVRAGKTGMSQGIGKFEMPLLYWHYYSLDGQAETRRFQLRLGWVIRQTG